MGNTQRIAYVVDDHPLVAKGIADFIQSCCDFSATYAVSSAEAFLLLLQVQPHISAVIVDFWLPGEAAPTLIQAIKQQYPAVPVLVMSADDHPAVQAHAKAAGADGFILKQESPQVFADVLMRLLQGQPHFYAPAFFQAGAGHLDRSLPVTVAELGLTPRQGEVLSLLLDGKSNKRIAQALCLSEQTVKEHITGILEKLGVSNRIEIMTKLRGRKLTAP